jgi:hypothetical protein
MYDKTQDLFIIHMLLTFLRANMQLCNPCPLGASDDVGMTTPRHYLRLESTIAAVRYQSTSGGVMAVPSADINIHHIS